MTIDNAWMDQRITKTKALIEDYENALIAGASGQKSYTLNTGQTVTTVTKQDISQLQSALQMLESRLETYCARRNNSGASNMIPGW